MENMKQNIVFIAGISPFYGKELVTKIAQNGAKVIILSSLGFDFGIDNVEIAKVDITSKENINKAINALISTYGTPTKFIHNVDEFTQCYFLDQPVEELERTLQIVLMSAVYLLKEIVPFMINKGVGNVLVIGSKTVEDPPICTSSYTASKAALKSITLTLSKELQNTEVKVDYLDLDSPFTGTNIETIKLNALKEFSRYL